MDSYRIDSHQKQVQGQDGGQLAVARLPDNPLHDGNVRLGLGQASGQVGISLVHGLANVLHADAERIIVNSNCFYNHNLRFLHSRCELVQSPDEATVGLGGIEAPQGHPQLQLWNCPEERVDGLDDLLGLLAALRRQAAQSGVQGYAAHSCRK